MSQVKQYLKAPIPSEKVSVKIHYAGRFNMETLSYNGGATCTMSHIKYNILDFKEFQNLVEDITDITSTALYFCMPGMDIRNGLRILGSDKDFMYMVKCGIKAGIVLDLYVDHYGTNMDFLLESIVHNETEKEVDIKKENDAIIKSENQDEYVSQHIFNDPVFNEDVNGENQHRAPNSHCMDTDEFQGSDSEINDELKYPLHDPNTHWKIMKPIKGERYESLEQLKDCIINYAVANGYKLYFEESKSNHLLVKCGIKDAKKKGVVDSNPCPFRLWASKMRDEASFQIKSLNFVHRCSRDYNLGSIVSSGWIAKTMGDKIRENPKIKLRQLKQAVMKKYQVKVSDNMCRRAKAKVFYDDIQSKSTHYTKIWDYGAEIEKTNPGSNVQIDVQTIPSGETIFQRMYVCFAALKEGWIGGCRKVIGLDGCFLKGIAQGELLSAVGRDANNQVYPIAWAVVDVETTDNWRWFISMLRADLGLGNGDDVALLSDQHKGLLEAVRQVLPNSEHRQCIRHVFANFSKKWAGVQFRGLFWGAAKSTYVQSFDGYLEKIKQINEEAFKDLSDKRPYNWSRAYFRTGFDCDAVENGISECWNSMIKDTRGKPIIRMLEDIRLIVMARLISQRSEGERWTDDICPNIRIKLEESKLKSRKRSTTESGNAVRSTRTRRCGKCREVGHFQSTCKNETVETQTRVRLPKGRPKNPNPSKNANTSAGSSRQGFRYGLRGGRVEMRGGLTRGKREDITAAMNLVDVPVTAFEEKPDLQQHI